MSVKKVAVKVTIAGEEYALKSDVPPEHARAVAEHVDQVIKSIMDSGNVVETHRAAILAALQITDQLFQSRQARDELANGLISLSADVRRWLPPAKRVAE
ncbi:MAG: cell division protein ZapA [Gemmatimonadaceae bacterium]